MAIGARFAGSVVAGVALLLLAPLLGAVLALVTFLRRSRAKRAVAAAAAPQQPPWGRYRLAMSRSTRSSWALNGSLQSTVRWAWSLSFRCTQSTV